MTNYLFIKYYLYKTLEKTFHMASYECVHGFFYSNT